MHLVNQTKGRYILLTLFAVAFLLTRLPGIPTDIINPDAVNWHNRSEQFVVGLKHFQLERTYQHYQPGITLMWITGPTVELVKQITGETAYTQDSFLVFHLAARTMLIFVQLALIFTGVHLLGKFLSFKKSLLVFSLFSFEPFFVANSRILHLDVLLTLLLFNGLLLTFLYIRDKNWRSAVLAGIFLAFATLTKSVAIGGVLFAVGMVGIHFIRNGGLKIGIKSILLVLVPAFVTFIAFFPALWVNARYVLELMYDGIERVGIRKGHNQILFGKSTRDAGLIFYPLVFALKSSPFFLALSALSLSKFRFPKLNKLSLETFLTIFYVGYLIVMTVSTKKIDRYFLPVYPYLSLLIVLGLFKFKGLFQKVWFKGLFIVMFSGFVILPLVNTFPHYFTYVNPMFGSTSYAHENILAQKPFGVGIPGLKDEILEKYGYYPRLGFLDKKPMASIYKGSRIYDARIDGTRRYDLLILGVNEEIPEEVLTSGTKFVKDHSVYINGLEYWKIYVKEN